MNIVKYIIIILIIFAVAYAVALVVSSFMRTKKFFGMKQFPNYHTHTTFCDGKNSPEEFVKAAIDIGMPILGFSAHSHLPTEPEWTMSEEGEEEYKKTILELREKYKNQIDIRLGIEQDFWSSTEGLSDYDFVIGSVHSLNGDDTTWSSVDYKKENFLYGVEHYFGGDREAAAVRYFELVSQVYDKTKCDIIGHFDLITIFNDMTLEETGEMFVNTDDPRVVEAERKALEKLAAAPVIFEINTGGINRGKTKHPYPSDRVMQFLGEHKIPVILSSDAHEPTHLVAGFTDAMKLVEKFDLNIVYDYKDIKKKQEESK